MKKLIFIALACTSSTSFALYTERMEILGRIERIEAQLGIKPPPHLGEYRKAAKFVRDLHSDCLTGKLEKVSKKLLMVKPGCQATRRTIYGKTVLERKNLFETNVVFELPLNPFKVREQNKEMFEIFERAGGKCYMFDDGIDKRRGCKYLLFTDDMTEKLDASAKIGMYADEWHDYKVYVEEPKTPLTRWY